MSATPSYDWSKAKISENNPCGIYGVDFIEYAGPDAAHFEKLFAKMGFSELAQIPNKKIKLFRQGDINFVLNAEPKTFAHKFSEQHGSAAVSTGFRVADAELAFKTAISRGARAYDGNEPSRGATPFFAIYGIGDSLVYFVDKKNHDELYTKTFGLKDNSVQPVGYGLKIIDHFIPLHLAFGYFIKLCLDLGGEAIIHDVVKMLFQKIRNDQP